MGLVRPAAGDLRPLQGLWTAGSSDRMGGRSAGSGGRAVVVQGLHDHRSRRSIGQAGPGGAGAEAPPSDPGADPLHREGPAASGGAVGRGTARALYHGTSTSGGHRLPPIPHGRALHRPHHTSAGREERPGGPRGTLRHGAIRSHRLRLRPRHAEERSGAFFGAASKSSTRRGRQAVADFPPMELTLGLIGFGNTGRAFVRLLLAKRRELLTRYDLSFRVTGITTKTHGSAIDPEGLDCKRALRRVEAGKSIADLHVGLPLADAIDFIRRRPARILFELTPLNPWNGLPALDHVRVALQKGLHVVTANKGPVAVAYRELRHLAREKKLAFRFEGTVLDGTPVFNLVEKTLLGTQILR